MKDFIIKAENKDGSKDIKDLKVTKKRFELNGFGMISERAVLRDDEMLFLFDENLYINKRKKTFKILRF